MLWMGFDVLNIIDKIFKEVIVINLLFWNLAKNSIESYVADILEENNIDIGVFAEHSGSCIDSILAKLGGRYHYFEGNGVCDKIILFAKSEFNITVRREQSRYAIYSIQSETEKFILVGTHLQDNLH